MKRTQRERERDNLAARKRRRKNPEVRRSQARAQYLKNPEPSLLRSRRTRKKEPELIKVRGKNWRDKNPGYWIEHEYGITLQERNSLLSRQNGACAVCKEKFLTTPHIDHDHETNQVRGLLCRQCNIAIGLLKDSSAIAQQATEYLKQHGK